MRFLLILFFLFAVCPSWQAADIPESMELGLKDVLLMAQDRNVGVIVANERVRRAIAQIHESGSEFLPQLTAEASGQRQTTDIRGQGLALGGIGPKVGPFNSFEAKVKLTQMIFDPSALARLDAARKHKLFSDAELKKARQDAMALTAVLFINARLAAQKIPVTQVILDRDKSKWDVALTKLKQGQGTSDEATFAEAAHAASEHLYQSAESDAEEKRLDLLAALGIPLDTTIIFKENDDPVSLDPVTLPDMDDLLKGHPDIDSANELLNESKAQQVTEKWEYAPKISAFGDYGPSGKGPAPADSSETYSVGAQVSFPILDGGLKNSRIRQAESQTKENAAKLDDVVLNTKSGILSAQAMVRETESLLKEKDLQLQVSQQRQRQAEVRFNTGSGNAQLAVSRFDKTQAQMAHLLSQIHLARSLGKIENLILLPE
jgi:outer membrane protein